MLPSQKGYCFGSALFLYLNRNAGFTMKKIKRFICIIMSVIILVSAPLTSYMEARAVEFIAVPFIEELLVALGISFGLGAQNDFSAQLYDKNLEDYFNAAASGGTFKLPEYGTVDFSDAHSILSLFDWSMKANMSLLTGDPSHMDSPLEDIDSAYADAALKLDLISYHNTGTCATNAMDESISAVYDDYSGSSEMLADDIQDCFTIIKNGGDFTSSTDDEKTERMLKIWKTFSAITAAGMIGFGNTALPLSTLKEYGNSEFSEYDVVFGDAYFDGNYKTNADGQYVYSISGDGDTYRFVFDKAVSPYKIVGVIEQNMVSFYRLVYEGSSPLLTSVSLTISKQIVLDSGRVYENGKSYNYCYLNNFTGNTPLYSTRDAARDALVSGDFSDAENIQSSYADFKSNIKSAGAVVGSAFSNYVASLRNLSNLIDIIPGISDASNTYGGTAKALEEVADILNNAAGLSVSKPGVDDPDSSSGNYSGILGKILSAINGLPAGILAALTSKFMTANTLTNLINSLPSLFVTAFSAMLDLALKPVISAIDAVPVLMDATLSDIFPDSIAAGKALIAIPRLLTEGFAATVEAVSGIVISVPDVTIPDIVIPEIVIPEIIADVVVGSPEITLNPSYDITVTHDYTGLEGIIFRAVSGVMTDVFVPDEAVALEKVGEIKEYFKFKDDVEDIVSEFEKKVFGIKPSPILKIPIGKPTSKKYNFGTGNYIIIDVSWYAQYKDFGDKIILAFAWAFFIWRIFVLMPGIISGGVGGFFETRDLWNEYSISRAYKNYDNLTPKYTSKNTHGD